METLHTWKQQFEAQMDHLRELQTEREVLSPRLAEDARRIRRRRYRV